MTDRNDNNSQGKLFYDGTCPMCCRSISTVAPLLAKRGVAVVPFENGSTEPEMRVIWQEGRTFGGVDAALFLTKQFWWGRPLIALTHLPGVRAGLDAAYRHIARNRHCRSGNCAMPDRGRPKREPTASGIGWLVAAGLVMAALGAGWAIPTMPAWCWMWILAGAMWLGFKVIAWRLEPVKPSILFLFWVGMDARAFTTTRTPGSTDSTGIIGGFAGLAAGTVLITLAATRGPESPILTGWLGMAGLIGTLHFGLFDLMARLWNRLGFPVATIMRAPWRASSLADFWGVRWNRAFSDVARGAVFRPLVRKFGAAVGTLGGFLLSGLAHELVISVPAGAGHGLPTLYFLIQGLAILAERRWIPRGKNTARWMIWAAIIAPAGILFHPTFLETVISPLFRFPLIWP